MRCWVSSRETEGETQMEVNEMVKICLGEKRSERVKVKDGTYNGVIEHVSEVYATTDYQGRPAEKICLDIRVQSQAHGKVLLPLFMTAVVSDAGKAKHTKYSNSRLYDLLTMADKLTDFLAFQPELDADGLGEEARNKLFASFLRKALEGIEVELVTKTVQPQQGEPYSIVSEVIRIVGGDPMVVEESVPEEESVKPVP